MTSTSHPAAAKARSTVDNVGAATPIPDHPRPSAEIVARFSRVPAANIADAMNRLGSVDSRIKPVWEGARITGSAFTVWTRPGDNQGLHEALKLVQPGDVLVVNGGGDETRALLGELIGGKAKIRGAVGFVIDGAVRDATGLRDYDMPVFARATTPAGPYKDGPHVLLTRVAIGGVVVSPGDIIVADEDGVVVVPLDQAEAVAAAAEAKQADEQAIRDRIDADLGALSSAAREGSDR